MESVWLSDSVKNPNLEPFLRRPAVQARAVIADVTAALNVCSQFTLKIICNLMVVFWIHVFQQVSHRMWGLSVNYKLKVNAASCTLAFSRKFSVTPTLRVSSGVFVLSLQSYYLIRANPEDFASGASCLVRCLCFQILPKLYIWF